MRKSYVKPELEIVEFDSADIIITSGGILGHGEGGGGDVFDD